MRQSTPQTGRALSPGCSIPRDAVFVDTALARGEQASIGEFRCPVTYPAFRDTGPIEQCIMVFPRTSVWIRHEGSHRFLADPTVVTIYNRGQRYERFKASPEGDRCDWFGVSDHVARDIAAPFNEGAADSQRPFPLQWAPVNASLYLRQRALVHQARRNALDRLECDEEVIGLVGDVMSGAHQHMPAQCGRPTQAARRRYELVEETRRLLACGMTENRSVREIASALNASPYHLCRVFRAHTGMTMHRYRTELRVRAAMEQFEGERLRCLSTIAHDLGFSSHSHFVRAMRRHAKLTPGAALRTVLR